MPEADSKADAQTAELQARTDQILWFHSIDLGHGVRTKGLSELAFPADKLPDFAGKSVLDIGAWDGYYSFLAERHGASRVVALDHYAWGVDFGARGAYWNDCIARGELPDHARDTTDFWRPELPGRRGFEFAKEVIGSKVEPYLADFMTTDLDALGTFDVSLYLGVLYHMKEPLTALERLRAVTGSVAVIETEALHLQGLESSSLLRFVPGSDVGVNFGNWYVPTITALEGLCLSAGFSRVEVVIGPPTASKAETPGLLRRNHGTHGGSSSAPSQHYRALVHAYV